MAVCIPNKKSELFQQNPCDFKHEWKPSLTAEASYQNSGG